MTAQFQNRPLNNKHEEKTLEMVTLEQVQKLTTKHLGQWYSMRALVRDDGRIIVAFRTKAKFEQTSMEVANGDEHGDKWYQFGTEKIFSWSDDYDNYNVVVAEFWTDRRFDYEEGKQAKAMADAYFGVKEDTGRYSIYDVYSTSELL